MLPANMRFRFKMVTGEEEKFPPAQSTVRVRALVLLACIHKCNPDPVRTLGKTKNLREKNPTEFTDSVQA